MCPISSVVINIDARHINHVPKDKLSLQNYFKNNQYSILSFKGQTIIANYKLGNIRHNILSFSALTQLILWFLSNVKYQLKEKENR